MDDGDFALDEDLVGDGGAERAHGGAAGSVDGQDEGPVEGVLLLYLDASTRAEAELVEEGDDVRIRRSGNGDDGDVARLEGIEGRQ